MSNTKSTQRCRPHGTGTARNVAEYSSRDKTYTICVCDTPLGVPRVFLEVDTGKTFHSVPVKSLRHGFDLARSILEGKGRISPTIHLPMAGGQ